MARAQKCRGGCGKSQDVTVEAKGTPKAGHTFTPPWICPECKEKIRRKEEEDRRKKDAATATPPKAKDPGFTLLPPRPKLASKKVADPVEVPQAEEPVTEPEEAPATEEPVTEPETKTDPASEEREATGS